MNYEIKTIGKWVIEKVGDQYSGRFQWFNHHWTNKGMIEQVTLWHERKKRSYGRNTEKHSSWQIQWNQYNQ